VSPGRVTATSCTCCCLAERAPAGLVSLALFRVGTDALGHLPDGEPFANLEREIPRPRDCTTGNLGPAVDGRFGGASFVGQGRSGCKQGPRAGSRLPVWLDLAGNGGPGAVFRGRELRSGSVADGSGGNRCPTRCLADSPSGSSASRGWNREVVGRGPGWEFTLGDGFPASSRTTSAPFLGATSSVCNWS